MRNIIDIYEGIFDKDNSKKVGIDLYKHEVLEWLKKNCQSKQPILSRVKEEDWERFVEINSDRSVNINTNLYICSEETSIPFKLNKVKGAFVLYHTNTNECKNFPNECDTLYITATSITLENIDMTLTNTKYNTGFDFHPREASYPPCVNFDNYVKIGKNVKFTCSRNVGFNSNDPRFYTPNTTWIYIKNFPEPVMKNIELVNIQDIVIHSKMGKWPTIEQLQKHYNNFKDLKHIYMATWLRQQYTGNSEIYITDKNKMEYVESKPTKFYD
jgi:hypothetical protein